MLSKLQKCLSVFQLLQQNFNRVKRCIMVLLSWGTFINSCFEWESAQRSLVSFVVWKGLMHTCIPIWLMNHLLSVIMFCCLSAFCGCGVEFWALHAATGHVAPTCVELLLLLQQGCSWYGRNTRKCSISLNVLLSGKVIIASFSVAVHWCYVWMGRWWRG